VRQQEAASSEWSMRLGLRNYLCTVRPFVYRCFPSEQLFGKEPPVTTWQAVIDRQRGALCGDMVAPRCGRPVEEHAYLGIHPGGWRG
jgi:hypothetical protein